MNADCCGPWGPISVRAGSARDTGTKGHSRPSPKYTPIFTIVLGADRCGARFGLRAEPALAGRDLLGRARPLVRSRAVTQASGRDRCRRNAPVSQKGEARVSGSTASISRRVHNRDALLNVSLTRWPAAPRVGAQLGKRHRSCLSDGWPLRPAGSPCYVVRSPEPPADPRGSRRPLRAGRGSRRRA